MRLREGHFFGMIDIGWDEKQEIDWEAKSYLRVS